MYVFLEIVYRHDMFTVIMQYTVIFHRGCNNHLYISLYITSNICTIFAHYNILLSYQMIFCLIPIPRSY